MNKFYGAIGYAVMKEASPGVWRETVSVRYYSGDVIRNTRQLQATETANDNLNISNQISIVADPFAYENFHSIRYVEFMGAKWKINNVEVQYPRLILSIGGVYHEEP